MELYGTERKKRKDFLRGMEMLAELGGFVKDQIEDELSAIYPREVLSVTKKYCPVGPGIWEVADAVERALIEMGKYDDCEREIASTIEFDDDEEDNQDMGYYENADFEKWVVEQVARIETDNYKNGKGMTEPVRELSEEMRTALMSLNALDRKILYLLSGIENEKELTIQQIAQLPEFLCSEEYIAKVKNVIDQALTNGDRHLNL